MLNPNRDSPAESTDPLVTIVTPTFNQANFLPWTIDSILQQSYSNIEYVIINDGSTDGTEAVLKDYTKDFTWYTKKNSGQANTLNEGWANAKGKYIGYLSSDDILRPEAIAKMVAYLERHPECVCVYPDSDLIDNEGRVIKKNVCKTFDLPELIIKQECYIGPGAIFRRDVLNEVGGWDPSLRLAPDREFWMRISTLGNFHFLNEALAEYRLHGGSLSYTLTSYSASLEYVKVLDKYFLTCNDVVLLSRKNEAYAYAYYLMARNALREGKVNTGARLYLNACKLHKEFKNPRYVARLLKNVISKPARMMMTSMRRTIRRG